MLDLKCLSVARAFGLPGEVKEGEEVKYLCPRHDDHRPSLSINPKKNVWMCGPCGRQGTAWQLVAFLLGVDPSRKFSILSWLRRQGLSQPRPRERVPEDRNIY